MELGQDLQKTKLFYSKVLIRPLYGRSAEIILNRTKYEIGTSEICSLEHNGTQILLPSNRTQDIALDLSLIEVGKDSFYILSSLNNIPFKQNGNLVYKSILSNGDKVDIGYNRLEFLRDSENLDEGSSISDELVKSNLPIFLQGETGVGKSYLAKYIHDRSDLSGQFVHINLSSFSSNLLESELFGHVKGAFTGAINEKMGAIEEARGGTLFLDEIDSISLEVQTKLLLFLDSKKVRKVGGIKEKKVDVRIIFASGQCLKKLVEESKFRKDMYYRITYGANISLLPLRHDKKKVQYIIKKFELENNCVVSIRLEKFLCSLNWPGNIRQLRGHLEKKLVLTKGRKLDYDHNDEGLIDEGFPVEMEQYSFMKFHDLKVGYFSNVVTKLNGDLKLAAKKLDVSLNTVKNVLKDVA
jgi:transcriptional regulator with PAS, ATPase and Fis domain